MNSQNNGAPASFVSSDSPIIACHESLDGHELGPRKKSRKSSIMEALRRGASQETGVSVSSRQMSTSTVNIGPASPRFPTRSRSPVSTSKTISPTGLPFYRHTEKFGSSSLPPLSTANVKYLRDLDQANVAVAQMMDRMEPFPGSRWRGVVGFDMEWTVDLRMFQKKTGLIQVSDTTTILLIQISAMDSFPHKLKDLICSSTILKVGVNIGADMKKLCRDFDSSYAARGVLDLSHLARLVDVGLVGTKVEDLDSSKATLGVGIRKDSSSGCNDLTTEGDATSLDIGDELSGGDNATVPSGNKLATLAKKPNANEIVQAGRKLISLARLVRRYLACELEKGDVRTSNWDKILTMEQKRYAANDAHAGLALYHELQKLYSYSIANGSIPVPSPAPWESQTFSDQTKASSSAPQPAPPPFRSKVTNRAESSTRKFIPLNELQNLTPLQLESTLPWDSLVKDLHEEFESARAAVLVKRKQEGVDLKGRGEEVVAAEADANSDTQETDASSQMHASDLNSATSSNPTANPLGDTYYDNPRSGNTYPPPGRGKPYGTSKQYAYQEKRGDVLGKKWPPTRNPAPRPSQTSSVASLYTTPMIPRPAAATKVSSGTDETDSQSQESTRPRMPTGNATSPAPRDSVQPSAQHLRAYLLWHKQQLPLSQICISMRSARYPLAKTTVISYIVEALKADEKAPFDSSRLRALVDLDTTNWVRENYKQFLESKVGHWENESQ